MSPISIPPTPTNGRRSSRSLVPTSLSSHEFYESQAVEGILCASGDGEVLGHTGPDEFPPELNMGMDASTDLQMMTFSPDTVGSFLGPSTWWAADISTPLSATGLLSVTPEILGRLHETFFNAFSDALPIIARDNFYSRLREFPTSLPILAVTYSVALLGTLVSDEYRHLEKSCCGLARQYLDACESDDLSDSLASITVLQALLCLIRFDICKRNCPRAYITFGRAERLASMMRLHHMDKSKTGCTNQASPRTAALHIKLPSTQVLIELEERRRCYWALFIFGGYVSIYNNTVVPYDQNVSNLRLLSTDRMVVLTTSIQSTICLPCPGDLGSTFHPQGMPCIDDAIEHGASGPISPFAGLVLVVALIRRALDHAMQTRRSEGGFWDRHYALTKHIEERGALLRPMFALRRLSSDAMALDVHLGFHAAEMIMCRTALDESARQGLSDILSCEPKKRLLAAALKVASTIRLTWSLQRQNVCLPPLDLNFCMPSPGNIRALPPPPPPCSSAPSLRPRGMDDGMLYYIDMRYLLRRLINVY